jgi:hypothetical protein
VTDGDAARAVTVTSKEKSSQVKSEGVIDGVTVIVGVTEGVLVMLGVTDGDAGVLVGVTVIDDVGVNVGVGVLDKLIVGVTEHTISTQDCPLIVLTSPIIISSVTPYPKVKQFSG